jgi:hypothetical protein
VSREFFKVVADGFDLFFGAFCQGSELGNVKKGWHPAINQILTIELPGKGVEPVDLSGLVGAFQDAEHLPPFLTKEWLRRKTWIRRRCIADNIYIAMEFNAFHQVQSGMLAIPGSQPMNGLAFCAKATRMGGGNGAELMV